MSDAPKNFELAYSRDNDSVVRSGEDTSYDTEDNDAKEHPKDKTRNSCSSRLSGVARVAIGAFELALPARAPKRGQGRRQNA